MAHSPLAISDISKLLMSDFAGFYLVSDWRSELRKNGIISKIYELLKTESRKKFIEFLSQGEDDVQIDHHENLFHYTKGFQNTGHFRISLINGRAAGITGLVMFIQNVTEEFQAFENLQKINSRLSNFFEYCPHGFALAVNGRLSFMNKKLIELTGFSNYTQGRNFKDVFPMLEAQSESTWRRKRNITQHTTIQHKDGHSMVVDSIGHLINEKGQQIKLVCVGETNSGSKVENNLLRYLVSFKQIADSIPDVLFQIRFTNAGHIEFAYFSGNTTSVLGFSIDILQDNPSLLLSYIKLDDINRMSSSFKKSFQSGTTWEDECAIEESLHSEKWISVRASIIQDHDAFEVSGIINNISEEKKKQKQEANIRKLLLDIHSNDAVQSGDIEGTYELLSRAIHESLRSDYVSFWFFDDQHESMCCDFSEFSSEDFVLQGQVITSEFYPFEWNELKNTGIHFYNVFSETSTRTNIFQKTNLFAAIIHNGQMSGVLQITWDRMERQLNSPEIQFIRNLTEIISYSRSVGEKRIFENELVYLNNHLSQLVQRRTEEVSRKRSLLEQKNTEITSSIRYAKHIQSSLLPSQDFFESIFHESFVIYEPKDIVAGDFYWIDEINSHENKETKIIACCDCTGHGVPGAMMSMLGSSALSRAVHQINLSDPSEILLQVNNILRENTKKGKHEIFDGMDASICTLQYLDQDRRTAKIQFAGANAAIWLFRKNDNGYELEIYKGDKFMIGACQNNQSFTQQTISASSGDMVYMFTDGMADQFGGPFGKKLKYRRMREMIHEVIHLPLSMQKRCIESAFNHWKGQTDQVDDVMLIGWKV
jgi:serine phosphatase RsbU (regulator of sigma subunit)/PAS domain-containing protein